MGNSLKTFAFRWITKNRKGIVGKFLYSLVTKVIEALENKNNDHYSNGEKWIIDSLSSDDNLIVFDVGANIGKWSSLVSQRNFSAQIHAFEPIPFVYEKLKSNFSENVKIIVNNIGLGDSEGFLEMNYYPENTLFSSFYSHPMGNSHKRTVKVSLVTGDTYCQIYKINTIDFLKIDVEGFESNVLFGFEKMISEQRIRMIQFEYGPLVLESKFLLKDFFKFFQSYGYKVGKLYPNYIEFCEYNYKLENFIPSNFIAVK
ncbi:FkbM family methyltransferase [Algoriphagus mannitolivorans]|uniref:FkbM family methyltransferase n=1 Tax=Algoriphagus mannitolivorans TaxID=226504 RepID=UPI0004070881|nr:FkbM family methyltransferase [Algoriphagus mannitolivorans]